MLLALTSRLGVLVQMNRHLRTFLSAALLAPLTACGGGSGGTSPDLAQLEIKLTDAPGEYSQVVVTIDRISVHTTQSNGFVDLDLNTEIGLGGAVIDVDDVAGTITVDLTELTNGRNILLATGSLPGGTIEQIRLHLVEATVDGTLTPWVVEDVPGAKREALKVPSGFQSGIKLVPRNVDVPNGSLTSITLDFDASRSVVALGGKGQGNRAYDYLLKPVIFVLESESLLAPATTIADGFNFPRGLDYIDGDDTDDTDDRIAVANAGTATSVAGSNDSAVVQLDPNDYATGMSVDATATDGSIDRSATTAPAVGLSGNESVGGAGLYDATSGDVLSHFDLTDFANPTTDTVTGNDLVASAPCTKLDGTGQAWLLARAGALEFFDPAAVGGSVDLGITGLSDVTDIAFLADYPTGKFGTLYVTDRGTTDQVLAITLEVVTDALAVSGDIVKLIAGDLDFLAEPIGIALNVDGDGIWVAQRGNGFIHKLDLDLTPVSILDTGLGANSLNGLAVVANPSLEGFDEEDEVLLLTSTNGSDDATDDDPLDTNNDSISTVEAVVP